MKGSARSIGGARVEQGAELSPGDLCSTNMACVEGRERVAPLCFL